MGKASKRKKERKEQGGSTKPVDKKTSFWQKDWFKYGGLAVSVIVILVVMVSLAHHYSDREDVINGSGDNGDVVDDNNDLIEEEEPSNSEGDNEDEVDENDNGKNDLSEKEEGEEMEDKPLVTMELKDGGNIKMELEPEIAPNTVNNFIHLVEDGFYDGLTFHRVIPGFMIQGGCPEGDGTGNPGYQIAGEFSANGHENDLSHERGILSMARSGDPDSAGSQFFIIVDESTHLDGEYAAFGRVIEGMDEADRIVNVDRDSNDKPLEEQVIEEASVETFGVEYGAPEKIENNEE